MKVLFLHHNQPDYLAESLFHGLRSLLSKDCVDVPRYDSMYAPLTDGMRAKLRGHGFTLYGLLEDIPELNETRFFWQKDLDSYDLVVIANIESQWELLWRLAAIIFPKRLVILDGSDSPAFFPFISLAWRFRNIPWSYFTPISRFKYFKRELIGEGASYSLDRFIPYSLRRCIPLPSNAIPISFSIPEEKISRVLHHKKKNFPTHIVDPDVANHLTNTSVQYTFSSEEEYYRDLSESKFGITTKRAGWDCYRHYELAANGCVLCFRDLDRKPKTCAPHGLDESNCIIYHSFDQLRVEVDSMSESKYLELQQKIYQWIEKNTTIARAVQFLKDCSLY